MSQYQEGQNRNSTPQKKHQLKNCVCPLYAYTRYDKMDPVHNEPSHYPGNLKTIYAKDYTPKKADRHNDDFSPLRTAEKTRAYPGNYLTTHKKDYTPKAAERSATPVKRDTSTTGPRVPFKGASEYQDMTKSPDHKRSYTPVKLRNEKPAPVSAFKDNTVYQVEYVPKQNNRNSKTPDVSSVIFRGTGVGRTGPFADKTEYRAEYPTKPFERQQAKDNGVFQSKWDIRPKVFDGLTIYKKDYVGAPTHYCVCPKEEESQ